MKFIIPKLDTGNALRFAYEMNSTPIVEPVHFRAYMNWVRPFGMLFTACSIRQLREKHLDIPFDMDYTSGGDGVSYASQMGFFKEISKTLDIGKAPGEAAGNQNYIPIREIDLEQVLKDEINNGKFVEMGDAIEEEAKKLAAILGRNNKEVCFVFTYMIQEILRNIPEHANTNKALICGQYYGNHIAEIAIVDEGIGVKASLRKNAVHREYVFTDRDAIECAVKAGVSDAFSPERKQKKSDVWDNSGFGLYMVNSLCQKLNGSFCIASGNKYLECINGNTFEGDTYFDGTAIKIEISTESLDNGKMLIQRIAQQGEEQAKSIRNAFKTASVPSKGLITGQ